MWQKLKNTTKPIVLYGMGNGADKILNILDERNIKVSGVFASDDFVRYQTFRGFTVKKYSDLEKEFGDMIVLVSFGTQRDDVLDNIYKISKLQELYAPDVPVYGDGLFDETYAINNKTRLENIYNLLADDQSKKVFENCIKYRISGKIDYLMQCETDESEVIKNVLCLKENENYLDLGAYTGDTVCSFLKYVDGYNKIIAVEPDKKNFKKLQKNTLSLQNVELINKGISNLSGTANFEMNAGRNSVLSVDSGQKIETICVDDICKTQKVSYIKVDVEGAELQAIEGAKDTILRDKPKMLISSYHKTPDYFAIPEKVLSIRNDYKVYMRHYKYIPAWDTQFYFV